MLCTYLVLSASSLKPNNNTKHLKLPGKLHCYLEYQGVKYRIPQNTGFLNFAHFTGCIAQTQRATRLSVLNMAKMILYFTKM